MESRNMESGQIAPLTMDVLNNAVVKWKSDLQFYKDDLIFIEHIMDHYLAAMVLHENLDEVRESSMRLQDLKYRCSGLLKSTASFRRKVGDSFQEEVSNALRTNYSKLKNSIQGFKADFKAIKVEIFSIANSVMEIEKKEKRDLKTARIRNATSS